VKLVESDLVQFSLRRTKGNDQVPDPKMELNFKIGQVILHTRPDSFQSFVDAINYYLDGLDLRPLVKEAPDPTSQDFPKRDFSHDTMGGEEDEGVYQAASDSMPQDLLASVDETMFGNPIPGNEKQTKTTTFFF
jgi:hypothetical protein